MLRVPLQHGEGRHRPLQRAGPHRVEGVVADAHPGLGHEGAVREALHQLLEDHLGLLPLAHLGEAVAQQVGDAVQEAVAGEAGE